MNTNKNARTHTRARTSCAYLVKMAKDFGFGCSQPLTQLGVNAKLSDMCCATCKGKQPPKPTPPKPKETCGAPSYKGDGNCDDNNNNEGCAYDGGDCCAKSVEGGVVKETYCQQVGCV